jgi:DNA (cytosine-5)-methyltransferase 1
MIRPVLLDLFCCGGGGAKGYHDAGFDIVGVDIGPQPHYPYELVQADALDYLRNADLSRFAAIHASPPCQAFCALRTMPNYRNYPNLIPQTRKLLRASGLPYVIENVPGAPLLNAVMLCGTMFGLETSDGAQLRRHRHFETNWLLLISMDCRHHNGSGRSVSVTGTGLPVGRTISVGRTRTITITGRAPQIQIVQNTIRETFSVKEARIAMGIDWLPMSRLSQAIPPKYTEFIGRQLIQQCHTF